MNRKSYPTDISEEQWIALAPLFAYLSDQKMGRPRVHPVREIVNALFYQVRTGCAWRLLPHDFPPHQTVSSSYYRWQKAGNFESLHDHLREQVRQQTPLPDDPATFRNPTPTAAIIDSQSVKTAGKRGVVGGTMGAKKSLAVSVLR